MDKRGKSGVLPAALLGVLHHLLVVVSCLLYLLPLGRLLLCHGLLLARHALVHPVSRTVRRSPCRLAYLV